jgi:hypothetical protein
VFAIGMLVPIMAATVPLAPQRTALGELAASARVCEALHPNDSVILVDPLWTPTIREQCGIPVAQLLDPTSSAIARVVASIRSVGRVPVVAGSQYYDPLSIGLSAATPVDIDTQSDESTLVSRPDGTSRTQLQFWLVRP